MKDPHVVCVLLREAAGAKTLSPLHVAPGHEPFVERPYGIDRRSGCEEIRGRGESPFEEACLEISAHGVVELGGGRLPGIMECRLDPATHHSISVQIVNRADTAFDPGICGHAV